MDKRNKIFYFQQTLNGEADRNIILKELSTVMDEIKYIYSFTVRVDRQNGVKYNVRYAISEEVKYNTLYKDDVVNGIIEAIERDKITNGKYIIGYGQPSLDLMVELYDPLVCSLATKQRQRWQMFEYDDLCQICRLTLVTLYNKGYYIHKRLLEKAFDNAVLQELRQSFNDFDVLSIETTMDENEDLEKLSIKDMLRDVDAEIKAQEQDTHEINSATFNEVKGIVVDLIGERQFEQLFRDYANGHTTTWSRRKLQTIKTFFELQGLTRQKFNNKYGR